MAPSPVQGRLELTPKEFISKGQDLVSRSAVLHTVIAITEATTIMTARAFTLSDAINADPTRMSVAGVAAIGIKRRRRATACGSADPDPLWQRRPRSPAAAPTQIDADAAVADYADDVRNFDLAPPLQHGLRYSADHAKARKFPGKPRSGLRVQLTAGSKWPSQATALFAGACRPCLALRAPLLI